MRLNESRMVSVVGDAFGVSAATSLESAPHVQHGVALLVGLERDVTVTDASGTRVCGRVVVVPPDLPHAVEAPGPMVGMLYDPESLPHVAGYARLGRGARVLDGRFASRLVGAVTAHRAALSRHDVLDGLGRETAAALRESPRLRPDKRVARVVEELRDPHVERRLLIEGSGLSEAHLQALFVRDVGLPIRSFRLWQRLLAAVVSLRHVDATRAAHLAGFADLAHFSRTCRRMLGHSPTTMRSALLAT